MKEYYFDKYSLLQMIPEACGQSNADIAPCSFTSVVFNMVVEGEGVYVFQDKSYPVKTGDIFITPPYQLNSQYSTGKTRWSKLWFACMLTNDETPNPLHKIGINQMVITAPQLKPLFTSIVDNHKDALKRSYYICSKAYQLLFSLQDTVRDEGKNNYIEIAKDYIQHHYQETITVSQIAATVGLERSYFSRLFLTYTGLTPRDYLTDFRLSQATRMIGRRDMSMSQIASLAGYRDIYTFSRAFKKKYMVSPSKYVPVQFGADRDDVEDQE